MRRRKKAIIKIKIIFFIEDILTANCDKLKFVNNRKELSTIFSVVLTDVIGFGIIIPLLPTITSKMGATGWQLGLLVASFSIAQFFASPILGALSDKYGRKPILIFSKAGSVLSYILLALCGNYQLLILSRIIDGISGGNITAARAYISDITTKENRHKGMAIIGIAFGIGFILGPAIGGLTFAISNNKEVPALIGAVLCFISLLQTMFFLEEKKSFDHNKVIKRMNVQMFLETFNNKKIQLIFLMNLVFMTIASGFQTTLPYFTDRIFGFTATNNGKLMMYLGILGLVTQAIISKQKNKDYFKISMIGFIILGTGMGLLALSNSVAMMIIVMAVISYGSGILNIFIPTMLSTVSENDPEGEVMGTYESVSSLGRIIGPAIFGTLVTQYTRPVYFIGGILFVLSTIYFNKNKTRT